MEVADRVVEARKYDPLRELDGEDVLFGGRHLDHRGERPESAAGALKEAGAALEVVALR